MREKNRFVIFVGNYINMEIEIEKHPLEPFLPPKAKLLMLGSFPPQRKRWSMDFYYPNLNNDMWRIVGLLFFGDKDHFLNDTRKAFCREQIIDFLNEKGIALFDTASSIRRLQDNASDKFLEVVQPTDIAALLRQLPECRAIVTTGQKATDTLRAQLEVEEPKVEEPQIPVTPAVTSAKSLKASTVKTGDVANITGIILILILSCTVIVLCGTMNAWRKAKKHHKKH